MKNFMGLKFSLLILIFVNTFHTNVAFLYPQKKNLFRRVRKSNLTLVNFSVGNSSCCKTLKRVCKNCTKFSGGRVSGKSDNMDAQQPRYKGMGSL